MIFTSKDFLRQKLPFQVEEGAHLCLADGAAETTEWEDVQEILDAPYVSREDFSGSILDTIGLELGALARNAAEGKKITVQQVSALFPKIDVERFGMNTWADLIAKLPNVKAVHGSAIEIKERIRPKPSKPSGSRKLRIQVVLDFELLCMANEAGLKGPKGCGISVNGLMSYIESRFGSHAEIVGKYCLTCKAGASDGIRDLLEANLKEANFTILSFPATKPWALSSKFYGYLKKALGSKDIDAVAILSKNQYLEWQIDRLVDANKPVLLLWSNGGLKPRDGKASYSNSRLAKAASDVADLDQLATKIHSRKYLDNALFSTGNGD